MAAESLTANTKAENENHAISNAYGWIANHRPGARAEHITIVSCKKIGEETYEVKFTIEEVIDLDEGED